MDGFLLSLGKKPGNGTVRFDVCYRTQTLLLCHRPRSENFMLLAPWLAAFGTRLGVFPIPACISKATASSLLSACGPSEWVTLARYGTISTDQPYSNYRGSSRDKVPDTCWSLFQVAVGHINPNGSSSPWLAQQHCVSVPPLDAQSTRGWRPRDPGIGGSWGKLQPPKTPLIQHPCPMVQFIWELLEIEALTVRLVPLADSSSDNSNMRGPSDSYWNRLQANTGDLWHQSCSQVLGQVLILLKLPHVSDCCLFGLNSVLFLDVSIESLLFIGFTYGSFKLWCLFFYFPSWRIFF